MELDPRNVKPYNTGDASSFASVSAQERWPVIITGAIDDVHRTAVESKDDTMHKEGKSIIEQFAALKYELQHNRALIPIPDDGGSDIEVYNEELSRLGSPCWHNAPWLYTECYLYRRMAAAFALSTKWKRYDCFSRQKIRTFKSSRPAVLELSARYAELVQQLSSQYDTRNISADEEEAEQVLFSEIFEACLWGNATDLSLLTNLSYEDIQKLQGSTAGKAARSKVLVNDLPAALKSLKNSQLTKSSEERRVDIILDNAGFELFGILTSFAVETPSDYSTVDLVLAGYLLAARLATSVVLHPKSIPWFVSDVVPQDFVGILNALSDPQVFYENLAEEEDDVGRLSLTPDEANRLRFLFEDWSKYHAEGKLIIRPNRFWTHPGSYWRLPAHEPALYKELQSSELVIFKGDLNYRKLTNDAEWSPTTPFSEAIGPLARRPSGIKTLALRTCKADVVVGLPRGKDEEIRDTSGGGGTEARKWAWSGKWALIQFYDGTGTVNHSS